jgi:hypothetical protein
LLAVDGLGRRESKALPKRISTVCVQDAPLNEFIGHPAPYIFPEHESNEHGSRGFGRRLIDQCLHISDEKASRLLQNVCIRQFPSNE